MNKARRIASVTISLSASAGLFWYLSETLMPWRIALSALMLLATFTLLDGFLRRA